MLILTRRIGDKILIGDDIEIVVSNIKGFQVRLAVEAPKAVKIIRAELLGSFDFDHAPLPTNADATGQPE